MEDVPQRGGDSWTKPKVEREAASCVESRRRRAKLTMIDFEVSKLEESLELTETPESRQVTRGDSKSAREPMSPSRLGVQIISKLLENPNKWVVLMGIQTTSYGFKAFMIWLQIQNQNNKFTKIKACGNRDHIDHV